MFVEQKNIRTKSLANVLFMFILIFIK